MAGGGHMTLPLVSHQDIDRRVVQDVLRHRWLDATVKSLEHEEPDVAMSPSDAADVGRCRRMCRASGAHDPAAARSPDRRRRTDGGSCVMERHRDHPDRA
jgi:hypothetical protein